MGPLSRAVRSPLLALAWLPAAGCAATLWQLGLGSGTRFEVQQVTPRGPYLDAQLQGPFPLRTFTPASDDCRSVLAPGQTLEWEERGIGGHLHRDGVECRAAGISDPLLDRARQPRATNLRSAAVPRDQANYSVLHEDESLALLRGYFPLAYLVRWSGGYDTVAAVPNIPQCRKPIESGVASMEYRDSGRPTLALVGESGLCPIVALLRPPGATAED